MEIKKILAVFAHPDDEAFGTGGSLAHYAAMGHEVSLVCATRGEVGEISDSKLATPETLGTVREGELRCAAETMGVKQLFFLGYRDSGMKGTAENQDPRAFINAPSETVLRRLVEVIRQIKPDIVVTFEPNGGYGHPDHIAIHKYTVAAFHAAADPGKFPKLDPPWQAGRLFYTAIPRSFFEQMRQELVELGEDTSDFDEMGAVELSWPEEQINVVVDVSDTVEAKWEALNCHRTQFGPGNLFRRLPEKQVKQLMSKEYFSLVWPPPHPGFSMDSLLSDFDVKN